MRAPLAPSWTRRAGWCGRAWPAAGLFLAVVLAVVVAPGCRSTTREATEATQPAAAPVLTTSTGVPASFEKPSCTVDWTGPYSTPTGATGLAHLTLRTSGDFHVNQEARFEVVVASNDVDLPHKRLGFDDATILAHDEIQMDVAFSATEPGDKRIAVHARMGVCSTSRCAECRERRELITRFD